jgi:hypothetical protein
MEVLRGKNINLYIKIEYTIFRIWGFHSGGFVQLYGLHSIISQKMILFYTIFDYNNNRQYLTDMFLFTL